MAVLNPGTEPPANAVLLLSCRAQRGVEESEVMSTLAEFGVENRGR